MRIEDAKVGAEVILRPWDGVVGFQRYFHSVMGHLVNQHATITSVENASVVGVSGNGFYWSIQAMELAQPIEAAPVLVETPAKQKFKVGDLVRLKPEYQTEEAFEKRAWLGGYRNRVTTVTGFWINIGTPCLSVECVGGGISESWFEHAVPLDYKAGDEVVLMQAPEKLIGRTHGAQADFAGYRAHTPHHSFSYNTYVTMLGGPKIGSSVCWSKFAMRKVVAMGAPQIPPIPASMIDENGAFCPSRATLSGLPKTVPEMLKELHEAAHLGREVVCRQHAPASQEFGDWLLQTGINRAREEWAVAPARKDPREFDAGILDRPLFQLCYEHTQARVEDSIQRATGPLDGSPVRDCRTDADARAESDRAGIVSSIAYLEQKVAALKRQVK